MMEMPLVAANIAALLLFILFFSVSVLIIIILVFKISEKIIKGLAKKGQGRTNVFRK